MHSIGSPAVTARTDQVDWQDCLPAHFDPMVEVHQVEETMATAAAKNSEAAAAIESSSSAPAGILQSTAHQDRSKDSLPSPRFDCRIDWYQNPALRLDSDRAHSRRFVNSVATGNQADLRGRDPAAARWDS